MVKPPTEKKKGKWADWKQKAWASDAFIAKEYPKKKDPDQDWETYSRHYQAYPGHCIDTEQATLDTIAKTITSELELDRIVEAWRFHDEVFQKPINHMALACGKFQEPPLLLVHGPRSSVYDDAKNDLIGAAVQIPGYIDINEASRKYFLQPEHKIQFKAVMAHELAHLALGHCKAENIALSRTKPMDTEWEIRADLMGAVIYGNPKKYAKAIQSWLAEGREDKHRIRARYSRDNLSSYGQTRMLHKWADRLEEHRWTEAGHPWNDGRGAIDAKGNLVLDPDRQGILRPLRAFDVLEHSKYICENFIDDALKAQQPPQGSLSA